MLSKKRARLLIFWHATFRQVGVFLAVPDLIFAFFSALTLILTVHRKITFKKRHFAPFFAIFDVIGSKQQEESKSVAAAINSGDCELQH
jgi:hypothetical protein